jgi:hypothetical protein
MSFDHLRDLSFVRAPCRHPWQSSKNRHRTPLPSALLVLCRKSAGIASLILMIRDAGTIAAVQQGEPSGMPVDVRLMIGLQTLFKPWKTRSHCSISSSVRVSRRISHLGSNCRVTRESIDFDLSVGNPKAVDDKVTLPCDHCDRAFSILTLILSSSSKIIFFEIGTSSAILSTLSCTRSCMWRKSSSCWNFHRHLQESTE